MASQCSMDDLAPVFFAWDVEGFEIDVLKLDALFFRGNPGIDRKKAFSE